MEKQGCQFAYFIPVILKHTYLTLLQVQTIVIPLPYKEQTTTSDLSIVSYILRGNPQTQCSRSTKVMLIQQIWCSNNPRTRHKYGWLLSRWDIISICALRLSSTNKQLYSEREMCLSFKRPLMSFSDPSVFIHCFSHSHGLSVTYNKECCLAFRRSFLEFQQPGNQDNWANSCCHTQSALMVTRELAKSINPRGILKQRATRGLCMMSFY